MIELLLVIAIIAILAALLLPALAGAKRRANLATCQSNFHQVSVACYTYANDYSDYFPPSIAGGDAALSSLMVPGDGFQLNTNAANTPVNPSIKNGFFCNLGYLYETKIVGNGKILYCPSFPDTSLFSPAQYSNPWFISTDKYGIIRSSMLYNPQIVAPTGPASLQPGANAMLFPKTGSIIPGRLFGMDCLQTYVWTGMDGYGATTVEVSANTFAHYPSQGFDVLFTDGSVQFVQSVPAFNYVSAGSANGGLEGGRNFYQWANLFSYLENGQ